MKKEHIIADGDEGIRLDRWFKRHYPALTHSMLEKYLRKGDIRLAGKKAKSSDRVMMGQALAIRCVLPAEIGHVDDMVDINPVLPRISPSDSSLMQRAVLYKDARVIVINKPYGLAVQGGSKVGKSVDSLLDALAEDGKRPKLTHRLDRDTSGVLVLARDAKTAAQLSAAFAGKAIQKTYWALVNGVPLQSRGTIDLPLLKGVYGDELIEKVGVDEEEGKHAVTEYRVLDSLARKFALMELTPRTGRMHQLRVHMEAIGCPIVGDHKYGGSTEAASSIGVENILHLHARRIVIPGNITGTKIDVTAPLPAHMEKSFRALSLDVPKKG